MTAKTYQIIKRIKKQIGQQKIVLEIGSLNINGSIKDIFNDAESYIGIDKEKGNNVDIVMNAHQLKFKNNKFDCVLALGIFEHDDKWWESLKEIRRVLKKNGWFILQVPSIHVHIHNQPDYWRFTPDGVKSIMKKFKDVTIKKYYRNVDNYPQMIRIIAYGRRNS